MKRRRSLPSPNIKIFDENEEMIGGGMIEEDISKKFEKKAMKNSMAFNSDSEGDRLRVQRLPEEEEQILL